LVWDGPAAKSTQPQGVSLIITSELVAAGGGELHFQLVVHIPGVRDPIRDFTDETFFLGAVDRPAQDDPAINGGDLHVFGIHGHSAVSNDFFADLRRSVRVGRVVALIERGQRAAVAVVLK
jgi:hypothetical protein